MRRLFKSDRVETSEQPPRERAGEALRQGRMAMGQEPADVARMLRIRLPYLLAIEDGRYDELPGVAYASGFLRSYAEHVGLNPDHVIRLYKEEMAGRETRRELYLPTPAAESRIPGGALLFGALVLASAVYGGWYYLSATDRSIVDLAPVLPDRLVAMMEGLPWRPAGAPADNAPARPESIPLPPLTTTPAPSGLVLAPPPVAAAHAPVASPVAPSALSPSPAASVAPPPAAPAVAPPLSATPAIPTIMPPPLPAARLNGGVAPPPAVVAAPPLAVAPPPAESDEEGEGAAQDPTPLAPNAGSLAVAPAAELAGQSAELAATGKSYGAQPHAASRIQLRATQETWVGVKDATGEQIFNRVLKPGEVYRAPDKPGLRVRLGNAGGVVLVIDGVIGAPMGAVGQVLRDVPLDAPSLRATSN